MTDLSPAANAVLDAYMNNCGWLDGPLERDYRCAAAVLRAAAMHLHSDEYVICNGSSYAMMIEVDDLLDLATELETDGKDDVRDQLLAIADELEIQ